MGRIVKLVGIVAAAVVVLAVILVLLAGALVDPNDYKDEIAGAVADATGRNLTLEGDLELEFFPSLRIAVGAAELSNAPGFGDAPFARIDAARLQLGLLALLSRRIEISEARLLGLRLNLARNADGTNNWQDFGGSAGAPPDTATAEPDGSGADLQLDVGAIEIADADVSWFDAVNNARWELHDFNLEASGFGPNREFPVSMRFGVAGEAVEVAVATGMRATLSLADNEYRLDELEVEIEGEGEGWPGGGGEASLRVDSLVANLDSETLELENLALEILGLSVSGTLSGRGLLSDMNLSGRVDIEPFDPRDILDAFNQEIETADPEAFRRASASAELVYDANQVGLRNMTLSLDDSELTGSMGLQGDAARFSLEIDAINIDRYLPPAAEGEGEEDEGSLDEVDLPLEVLRTLRASGDLTLREAQFTGLQLTDAEFSLDVRPNRLRLRPSASLYGGTLNGEIGIDVEGDSGVFSVAQQLSNVDLAPLARDYLDSEMVSGKENVSLDLTATGSNLGDLQRQLDGDVSFALRDGAWEGIDLWYELRRARAVTDRNPVPSREGEPRTPFSSISASGRVEDAILTNRDLNATLPFMTVDGSGTVNLLTNEMDFDLTATFVDGPALQSDPAMADLAGQALPLVISGTLDSPRVLPDFAALVRARARGAVQERVDEEREDLQDRVRDRLRGILDR